MRAWLVVVVLALLAGGTWWLLRPGEPAAPTTSPAEQEGVPALGAAPPPSLAPSPGRATPAAAMADGVADGSAHERVEPTDGSAPAAVEGPRARLEGVVLDDAGRPVAGARVRAMAVQDDATAAERREPAAGHAAECGPDGRFAFSELAAGTRYAVEAHGPLHAPGTTTSLPLSADRTVTVEIHLAPARFLDLVVRDAATAAPIAGAKITGGVNPLLLPGETDPPAPESDATGRLRIGPLSLATADFSIEAVGYLRASRSIPAGSEGVVEVNLVRALLLSGRVLRPDGSPAVRATVSLRLGSEAIAILHTAGWLTAETDERGAFSFAGLPALPVPLEAKLVPATVEGQAPPEPETGFADPEAGTSDCVIRLGRAGSSRAGSLTIRVVDPDGRPVPRARILIQSANMSMSTELTDGRFVHVRSETSGASVVHVAISGARDAEGAALPLAAAQMDVPASPSEVTIRLERSEPIRGVVRGPDGAPVAGATVQLLTAAEPPSQEIVAYAQTGDDGTFSLLGGPRVPGRVVVHALRGFLAPEPVDVAPGATGVDLRMRAGATAIVTVLDAGGAPVGGAKVAAIDEEPAPDSPMGRGEPTPPSVATDAEGRATLVGLDPARRYRLSVSPTSPGSRAAATPRWVPADTTVRLERALRITGVVRDREGRPVSGARVQTLVGGAIGTYDVDGAGRFVLDGLSEGTVSLRAVPYPSSDGSFVPDIPLPPAPGGDGSLPANGDPDPWIPVRAGATDVVLALDLGATLLVRVDGWSPEEGAGAAPFSSPGEAMLVAEGVPFVGVSHGARIADDGTIRFHRLGASKTYTLWIAPVGDRSLRKSGVRAGADLRVRLEAGKTLSFRVIGPGPLGNVALTLVGCPLSVSSWRAVNEDGTVDLRGYPPGRYTVQASTSLEGQAYMGMVTVEAGAPRVDLPLVPASTEGR